MELQLNSLATPTSSLAGNSRIAESGQQIASGQRINQASDDPAGIQVSIGLTREINENAVGLRNVMDGSSLSQVAQGGISQITDSVQQLRELSLQANNGTLNDSDRQSLQKQADALLAGIKDTIGQTSFNGRALLSEESDINIQTGDSSTAINTPDLHSALGDQGLFSLEIGSAGAIDSLDGALSLLNDSAGSFAASQRQLDSMGRSLTDSSISNAESRSRITDTDMAQATSEYTQALVQREVEITLQAQANASRGDVLALLGQ
ncbi:flagellin [Pontibacterium sp.]|uniref:flagellin n=1 Tax=Pontibacterium sp. TaxID=2036026 RepID=UPI003564072B